MTLATTKSKLLVYFQEIEPVKSKTAFQLKRLYLKSRDWFWYQEIGFDIKRLIHAFKRLGNLLECH